MVAANLDHHVRRLFGDEGGLDLSRQNPKNWTGGVVGSGYLRGTLFGVSIADHSELDIPEIDTEFLDPEEIEQLESLLPQVLAIYRSDYAVRLGFDDLPRGLDYAALDWAMNSGWRAPTTPEDVLRALQTVLGVSSTGAMNDATRQKLASTDVQDAITGLCNARLAWLQEQEGWATFGKGWTRRVEATRAFALGIVDNFPEGP